MKAGLLVSVVCRLHQAGGYAASLARELCAVLRASYENYELVLVDDGSTDDTSARVKELLGELDCVRLVRLSRRFGVDVALTAGLETAIGDFVVTMDGARDPPALVPALVERAQQDGAVVFGVDRSRGGQGGWRRLGARGFYWACRRLFELPLVPDATHLRALPRQAVNAIVEIRDRYRYLRALTPYIGFRTANVEYRQEQRGDTPADGFFESVETAISVVVSNSTRPLRYVSWLGLGASTLNLLYIGYVFVVNLFKRTAEGWTTLSLQNASMFLVLFVILTVVIEYIGRILGETRDRPLYYIAEEAASSVVLAGKDRRNVVSEPQ